MAPEWGAPFLRRCLCAAILILPAMAASAQDAAPAAFKEARIGPVALSLGDSLRRTAQAAGDTPAGAAGVGILTRPIAFPPPAAEPPRRASASRRATGLEFPYDPTLHATLGYALAEDDDSLVKMEPFHVSDSLEREAAEAIDKKLWDEASRKFRIESGGVLWEGSTGGLPVEVGISGHRDAIPTPARAHSPEWDLFTLRW